eukprot:1522916-Rhodomonas_salina.1
MASSTVSCFSRTLSCISLSRHRIWSWLSCTWSGGATADATTGNSCSSASSTRLKPATASTSCPRASCRLRFSAADNGAVLPSRSSCSSSSSGTMLANTTLTPEAAPAIDLSGMSFARSSAGSALTRAESQKSERIRPLVLQVVTSAGRTCLEKTWSCG